MSVEHINQSINQSINQESQIDNRWTMYNVPVISTAHLPITYGADLANCHSVVFAPYTDGAFVFIGECAEDELNEDYSALCRWVKSKNESGMWLRFDCDGDVYDELPEFDW